MPLLSKLPSFKKETSQQSVNLDRSDLLMLKELASFFLGVDFHGSQLEALLLARALDSDASSQGSNTDRPSILTPSPILDPSSASAVSEAGAGVETPIVSSQAGDTASPTSQPSTSVLPRPIVPGGDYSFANATINREDSSGQTNINNFCNTEIPSRARNAAFCNTIIDNSNINNASFNSNVGCFTTTVSTITHYSD